MEMMVFFGIFCGAGFWFHTWPQGWNGNVGNDVFFGIFCEAGPGSGSTHGLRGGMEMLEMMVFLEFFVDRGRVPHMASGVEWKWWK